jgi:hypothetical protein
MTQLEELTKCIKKLSADAVNTLLDAIKILLASNLPLVFLTAPLQRHKGYPL